MNVPVTVYAEMTPNPSTMKFVANKYLLITGDSVEFSSKAEAKGFSPLAEELLSFPFVKNVFIAANFVTITKTDNVPWDFINMEIREFIKGFIGEGKDVLIQMQGKQPLGPVISSFSHTTPSPSFSSVVFYPSFDSKLQYTTKTIL